ncbi:MAG: hypothetical protein Q7T23_04230 [Phenylobacterium sp.]|nr:hypothetical protein [Phenylobacterium sp.]
MLIEILAAALLSGSPESSIVLGTWKALPMPGVNTIEHVSFTSDGRMLEVRGGLIGPYWVTGNRVTVSSDMGTLSYERTNDGRLCVVPGEGFEVLAGAVSANESYTVCYRQVE